MKRRKFGRLHMWYGCMFSGKSRRLVIKANRLVHAGKKFQAFKPRIDDRYGGITEINSHDGGKLDATPVTDPCEIITLLDPDTCYVFIDEIQFFDPTIVKVVWKLLEMGIKIYAAGLDTDFRGEPFGSMRELLELAQKAKKLTAICPICGKPAIRTQRLVNGKPAPYDSELVVIGAAQEVDTVSYGPRCLVDHIVPNRPKKF